MLADWVRLWDEGRFGVYLWLGSGDFEDVIVVGKSVPWICGTTCPGCQSGNFGQWMLCQQWFRGCMITGQPGRGIIFPGQGLGLTEVLHHGTY